MSAPDIHDIAAAIWPSICKAAEFDPPPHGAAHSSYTGYGNSDAETEARACATKVQALIAEAVAREREACAQVAGWYASGPYAAADIAAAIRKRGNGDE